MLQQTPSNRIVRLVRFTAHGVLGMCLLPIHAYRRWVIRCGSDSPDQVKKAQSTDEAAAAAWMREVDAMDRF